MILDSVAGLLFFCCTLSSFLIRCDVSLEIQGRKFALGVVSFGTFSFSRLMNH